MLGYGVAVVSVAAAVAALALMQARWQESAPVAVLLIAVILSTWLGGTRPALLATALSILGLGYLSLRADAPPAGEPLQLVRLLSLGAAACYLTWLSATERGAAQSLRRAQRELQRNNVALLAQNRERERCEETARDSRELLRQVLATLPVGVAVTDQAGDIILTNAALRGIWGDGIVAPGRERWAGIRGYWHESGRRVAPAEWASVRALAQGRTTLNELIDIDTSDDRRRTIENSAAPIRNSERLIVGAVIVNKDVTERVRAEEALRESAKRLQQLSRRLLAVQEEERRHLSRELHDEFGQLLAAISLHLHAARGMAGEAAQDSLEESMALVQRAAAQLRSLALELRPTMLESDGLDATLRWLADEHRQHAGIDIRVVGQAGEVSGDAAIAAFRVVQEALTNVVRHARAQHVRVDLSHSDGQLRLAVRDDGLGFDAGRTLERAASRGNLGLLGMRERVQILGGELRIDSRAGHGTCISVSLPLAAPAALPAEQVA
jgi:signal transduction histidine kinase